MREVMGALLPDNFSGIRALSGNFSGKTDVQGNLRKVPRREIN